MDTTHYMVIHDNSHLPDESAVADTPAATTDQSDDKDLLKPETDSLADGASEAEGSLLCNAGGGG